MYNNRIKLRNVKQKLGFIFGYFYPAFNVRLLMQYITLALF